MKTALVTTTINVPRVLEVYASLDEDTMVFVIGDRKTPDIEVVDFLLDACPNHAYYGVDMQYKLGYAVAKMIPENCIQRRSIGFLEALKWGADIIVTIDDDNSPLDRLYFTHHRDALLHQFTGLRGMSASGWFDVGQLFAPKAPHRGIPYDKIADPIFESVAGLRVGVCAGACLGDPDISAVERIANGPIVHGVSEVLRHGVVVDPRLTWTVFNSQNTAFLRELTPAMFMIPHIGRADDIFASLICQRVMREEGLHVRFGHPMVWQQRNPHDLRNDLLAELICMGQAKPMAEWLNGLRFDSGQTVTHRVRRLWETMPTRILPTEAVAAALAWCDDIEKVL